MADVLFVCTGNLCRSPSAQRFLTQRLAQVGPDDVTVESVGTSGTSLPVPKDLLAEADQFGLDLRVHVPQKMDADALLRADLIIGMAREHVREVVIAEPSSFTKTFTLREIVRRGNELGQRRPLQPLTEWLQQISAGRRRLDLLGSSPLDDIPDPMGGTSAEYRMMLTEVATLTRTLHLLTWPKASLQ